MRRYAGLAFVSFVVCLLATRPSSAAQINYGTHSGTHVTYVNVTEDSGADEPLPLFGAPTVTGNSMDFNPIGFDAATSTTGGSDTTDSNLVFMVTAKSGSRISAINFGEAGNTTLTGNAKKKKDNPAASAVFTDGVLDIHEVDFAGINHISVPFSLAFSPSGGTYFLGPDGGGSPIYHTAWTGSATLDIDAILIANGFTIAPGTVDPDSGATKISIDLDDTLSAFSEPGASATINKTDFSAFVLRSNVPTEPGGEVENPEPSSFLLVGLAMAGLTMRRRERRDSPRAT
jgi:hypothetical protein